jgi:adenylosuccinate synthase
MNKVDVLLGLQWGDEGKGKIVDFMAPRYEVVARFQGGPNAGHTLEFDGIKHVLHQIPSGIFRAGTRNVIGNGVVLDPAVFRKEIDSLGKYNLDLASSLFISRKAQLIVPSHKLLDQAYEKAKGENKIGSTLRGIGPTYQDKVARMGLRVGDVLARDFREKFKTLTSTHFAILKNFDLQYNWPELIDPFFEGIETLKRFRLIDSEYFLNEELRRGSSILAEGAQGSLLDIDFGSYPFVTSSNTITAGACTGLGLAPRHIGEVFGIFKAYSTRVGSGPFPTELFDAEGEAIRKQGNEFGSTTGRPRRCGWLDLPSLKYSIMINGVSQLFMMKADVLNIFDSIKVCTHYRLADGKVTDQLPFDIIDTRVEPVYEQLPGWSGEPATDTGELPAALSDYVRFLENALGVPITMISVGPDRAQTILRNSAVKA